MNLSNQNYKFTGKERDSESGLDYFGARYYGNSMGRWMTTDPDGRSGQLVNPQSLNRYAYVTNNPVGRNDPDGKKDKPYNAATDTAVNWSAPGATPLDSPGAYNCHSFAWYGAKGWKNDPTGKVKQAQQLDSDAPNQFGDRVIYYVDKNGDGKWEAGEAIVHSAVVTEVDSEGNTTEVTGKMGQLGVGTNHPDAPDYYKTNTLNSTGASTKRAYFRPQKPIKNPPQLPQPPQPQTTQPQSTQSEPTQQQPTPPQTTPPPPPPPPPPTPKDSTDPRMQ